MDRLGVASTAASSPTLTANRVAGHSRPSLRYRLDGPSPAMFRSHPRSPSLSRPTEDVAFFDALERRLVALGDDGRRVWWERYLKGAVPFRGVPMAGIRASIDALWVTHALADRETHELLRLALGCFARRHCEDKLAGVLLLAEHVLHRLDVEHLATLARPFEAGDVADWNTCDWTCVKVLGPLVEASRDPPATAAALADWRRAPGLWQRRAAAVAFVGLAPGGEGALPGLPDLVFAVCDVNVADPTRWSQTSVGWVLRELSRAEPDRVRTWLDAHPELSAEARRSASKHLA